MPKSKQVKTKLITVEYTDGQKIVINPYFKDGNGNVHNEVQGYGFTYYDRKGRMERYEGSWNAERISNWFREILDDDSTDYEKEFDRIQMMYSTS